MNRPRLLVLGEAAVGSLAALPPDAELVSVQPRPTPTLADLDALLERTACPANQQCGCGVKNGGAPVPRGQQFVCRKCKKGGGR